MIAAPRYHAVQVLIPDVRLSHVTAQFSTLRYIASKLAFAAEHEQYSIKLQVLVPKLGRDCLSLLYLHELPQYALGLLWRR